MDNTKPPIDPKNRRLELRRESASGEKLSTDEAPAKGLPPFFGAMKGLMKIVPDADLTEPADPGWGRDA